jgi:putative acetyltransferase
MHIRQDDPTAPHVADLLRLHLGELHSQTPLEHAFALDASGLSAPEITFWTVWDGDTFVGFGALRQLEPGHGEVKSMRTVPGQLRRGVARAMLAHVVETARARGYTRLSLETGTGASFLPAIALYEAFGFEACGPFADYAASPHNCFFTRTV